MQCADSLRQRAAAHQKQGDMHMAAESVLVLKSFRCAVNALERQLRRDEPKARATDKQWITDILFVVNNVLLPMLFSTDALGETCARSYMKEFTDWLDHTRQVAMSALQDLQRSVVVKKAASTAMWRRFHKIKRDCDLCIPDMHAFLMHSI
jgi:hypothetical protein